MRLGDLDMRCGECSAIDFCGVGFGYAICSDCRFEDTDDDVYAKIADTCPPFDRYPECNGCERSDCDVYRHSENDFANEPCDHKDEHDDYNAGKYADYVFEMLEKRNWQAENNIEIFFDDLSHGKQVEILARLGNNGNFDVFPIAVIPVEEDDPGYNGDTTVQ